MQPAVLLDRLCGLRVALYTFFSTLFYREADEEVYEKLDALPPLLKAYAKIAGDESLESGAEELEGFLRTLKEMYDKEMLLIQLARSFASLFLAVSERGVPVWESVYLGRRRLMCQEPLLDVKEFYARFGLVRREDFRSPTTTYRSNSTS